MEYKPLSLKKQIKQGNLNDPQERERILMRYAGIFPNNIEEFASKFIPRNKKIKNHAR